MQEQFQLADVTKTIGAGNFYLSVRAADGLLDVRPMFAGLDGDRVVWNWHERERADAVILATGYRPSARLPPRAGRPGPWRRTAARRRDFHHPSE